jgi:hypothetical protein
MNYFNHIREYLDKNPSLQCIPVKDKAPFIQEWQSLDVTDDVIDSWEESYLGVANGFGFRAGQYNIGFLDIDTDDQQQIHKIDEVLDLSHICVKKGLKGKTVFFRFQGTPKKSKYNVKLRPTDKKAICEINFTSGQTVLPPSIHPQTGLPYKWISNSLLEIDIEDLPLIDESRIEYLETVLRAPSLQEGLKNVPTSITGEGSGKFHTMTKECARLLHLGVDESTIARTLVGLDRQLFTGNQFFFSSKIGKDKVSDTNDIENATMWVTTYKSNLMRQDPELRATLTSVARSAEAIEVVGDWGAVRPLMNKKFSLEFPKELFPDAFNEYCHELSRLSALPPEAYLGAFMATFSAACQAKVTIMAKRDFIVHPSISVMVVAPSGSRKDAIFDSACEPLMKLISAQEELCGEDFVENEKTIVMKIEDLNKKRKHSIAEGNDDYTKQLNKEMVELQNELSAHKKKKPRFIFESGTQEMLYELMNQNQDRGIFIRSSEYVQLLGNLAKQGNESLRSFYLKLLNGSTREMFSHQTKTGVNVNIRKVLGCALVGAQTDVLGKDIRSMERGDQADGLLQRFFIININPEIRRMEDSDKPLNSSMVDNLYALMYNHPSDIFVTWEDESVKNIYLDYDHELRVKSQYEKSAIKSFRNKYSGQSVKLAYFYEQSNAPVGKIATKISKKSFLSAVEWLEWQSRNLDITWSSVNHNTALRVAEEILLLIKNNNISKNNFYNDIQRHIRFGIVELGAALDLLTEHNYMRKVGNTYELNPLL